MYQKEKGERSGKSRGRRGKGLMLFEAADRLHSVLLFVCLFVLLIYRPFLQSHSVSEPIIISSREYASPDPPPLPLFPHNTAGINKQWGGGAGEGAGAAV